MSNQGKPNQVTNSANSLAAVQEALNRAVGIHPTFVAGATEALHFARAARTLAVKERFRKLRQRRNLLAAGITHQPIKTAAVLKLARANDQISECPDCGAFTYEQDSCPTCAGHKGIQ